MELKNLKVGQTVVSGKHTEADFEKEKKALVGKLHEAYQLSKVMEGNSVSGQQMNEELMQLMEKFKKQKFTSWDSFQAE
jgi:hypothetical protein